MAGKVRAVANAISLPLYNYLVVQLSTMTAKFGEYELAH
jgi:hypothetical protein